MRLLLSALTLCAVSTALAQTLAPAPSDSSFPAVRPDVVIYVKGHWTGNNLVEITMVDANYPPETLKKQVADLCERLGHPASGLAVTPYTMGESAKLKFLQATFGTAGLTDDEGNANLTPLIQA